MQRKIVRLFTLVGLAAMAFVSLSYADPITVPPGLAPGDPYRLVFVTSVPIDATSSDIDYYNAFVTAVANSDPTLAAMDLTWTAIVSTPTVNAIDNIGEDDVPVYNLAGQLVASSDTAATGGLWDTNVTPLANPIEFNEDGGLECCDAWTGTAPDGEAVPQATLGDPSGDSAVGLVQSTGISWLDAGSDSQGDSVLIYAISDDPVKPPTAPEPGTISLMLLGGMFLVGKMRSKRTKAN
jgi:hypothetical protein